MSYYEIYPRSETFTAGHYKHHYCAYCGKRAKEKKQWGGNHNRDLLKTHYSCTCEDALAEIKIYIDLDEHRKKFRAIETSFMLQKPKVDFEKIKKWKYKVELKELKKRHGY